MCSTLGAGRWGLTMQRTLVNRLLTRGAARHSVRVSCSEFMTRLGLRFGLMPLP